MAAVSVRHVRAGEAARLRAIRLAALADAPDAFLSTHAEVAARDEAFWTWWAGQSGDGSEQRTYVLADAADRWLGMALVRADERRPHAAVLNGMWVAPEARGQRGATLLCDACAAWAAERGFATLVLEVVVGNGSAERAYRAAGFAVTDRTHYRGGGRSFEEYVMTRAL